jgi:hypothetical protein
VLIAEHAAVGAGQLRNEDRNGEMLHGAKVVQWRISGSRNDSTPQRNGVY